MQKYKMLFDCTVCIKNTDYEISLSRAIVFTLACLLQKYVVISVSERY